MKEGGNLIKKIKNISNLFLALGIIFLAVARIFEPEKPTNGQIPDYKYFERLNVLEQIRGIGLILIVSSISVQIAVITFNRPVKKRTEK